MVGESLAHAEPASAWHKARASAPLQGGANRRDTTERRFPGALNSDRSPVGCQKSSCSVKRKVRPSLSVLVMRPKLGDVMLVVGSAN